MSIGEMLSPDQRAVLLAVRERMADPVHSLMLFTELLEEHPEKILDKRYIEAMLQNMRKLSSIMGDMVSGQGWESELADLKNFDWNAFDVRMSERKARDEESARQLAKKLKQYRKEKAAKELEEATKDAEASEASDSQTS